MDHYADVAVSTEGECWRMVIPKWSAKMRHPDTCHEPVTLVGRWKYRTGWAPVWSCEVHAD